MDRPIDRDTLIKRKGIPADGPSVREDIDLGHPFPAPKATAVTRENVGRHLAGGASMVVREFRRTGTRWG